MNEAVKIGSYEDDDYHVSSIMYHVSGILYPGIPAQLPSSPPCFVAGSFPSRTFTKSAGSHPIPLGFIHGSAVSPVLTSSKR